VELPYPQTAGTSLKGHRLAAQANEALENVKEKGGTAFCSNVKKAKIASALAGGQFPRAGIRCHIAIITLITKPVVGGDMNPERGLIENIE
jgi:hypothetical protein